MSDTIIIREAPARGRTLRTGFVLPAPSALLDVGPVAGALHAIKAHGALVCWWTLSGALLWPLTLVGIALVAPSTRRMMDSITSGAPPTEAQIAGWYGVGALGAGALVGLGQWLLVRRVVRAAAWWVPATACGWAAGMLGAFRGAGLLVAWFAARYPELRVVFMTPLWERYVLLGALGASLGILLGVAQWAVLCRSVSRSLTWIPTTAAAWTAATVCLPLLPRLPRLIQTERYTGGMETSLPGLVLAGAAYGLLTGFALALLLRSSVPQPVET